MGVQERNDIYSYIFILLFLPLCLLGYFVLNQFRHYRLGLILLIGMSLWFYGYFNPRYLNIICSSVIVNYIVYRLLQKTPVTKQGEEVQRKRRRRKLVFIGGLVFNIGLLGYFKYMDFFIENINLIFRTDFALRNILLPLGISFFTFQQLSFLVDVYKDRGGFYILFLSMRHM
ncbi:Peptidoglycan O-acetyltransferase [Schaedlerella arabinosiphila]|nr:Peptidoglycan O-acetyltransferase [Schaedlerella arabinosiphila]